MVTTFYGTDADDFTVGGTDSDVMFGGPATVFSQGLGNDTFSGFDNTDTLYGGAGPDTLGGDNDNDRLYGGAGSDLLYGGNGDDLLFDTDFGTNADVNSLYGGSGNDTITSAGGAAARAYGGDGNDVISGGAFILGNTLFGDGGSDTIYGASTTNTLIGGDGNDRLYGGNGNDFADYSTSPFAITIVLGPVTTQAGGDAQGDILVSIEHVIGTAFDDTITGHGGNNSLLGGAGADLLYGSTGDDTFVGGAGNDTFFGGTDASGTNQDAVDYTSAPQAVVLAIASTGTATAGADGTDTLVAPAPQPPAPMARTHWSASAMPSAPTSTTPSQATRPATICGADSATTCSTAAAGGTWSIFTAARSRSASPWTAMGR